MLAALAILAVSATALATLDSAAVRAEREAELLFRGLAYRAAIASYYRASPDHTFPRKLAHLLEDPRLPGRRHLRGLYPDPMTEDGEWTLVRAADGGIAGVASRSTRTPRKRAGFPPGLETFETAETYADWVFEFGPPAPARP